MGIIANHIAQESDVWIESPADYRARVGLPEKVRWEIIGADGKPIKTMVSVTHLSTSSNPSTEEFDQVSSGPAIGYSVPETSDEASIPIYVVIPTTAKSFDRLIEEANRLLGNDIDGRYELARRTHNGSVLRIMNPTGMPVTATESYKELLGYSLSTPNFTETRDMRVNREIIALETIAAYHPKLGVMNRIKQYFSDVKQYIMGGNLPSTNTLVAVDTSKLEQLFNSEPTAFVNSGSVQVIVPPGLVCPYTTYLDVLITIHKTFINRLLDDFITPLKTWVAEAINTPSRLEETNLVATWYPHDVEALEKGLTKCFKGKSDHMPFKKMVKQPGDLKKVSRKYNELVTLNMSNSPSAISAEIDTLAEYLDQLINGLSDPSSEFKAYGPTVELVSSATYQLAREVDFFSRYTASVKLFGITMADTMDKMERVIKG